MKKKLLLFGAVLLTSMASFAQEWVAPTFTPQEFVVSTEGSDTTFYYLYNVEAKAFFCAGNAWGTQASLGTPPQKCFFTQNEDGTYYLWTYVLRDNHGWDRLFIDNETQMFVDCYDNAQGTYREANVFWSINFLEGNIFRIYGAETNETYNQYYFTETSYMGYDWYEGVSMTGGLTPFLDIEDVIEDHQYMVDWMLVAPEDYDAIADKVAAYNSAMALQTSLQDAEDIYTEINLAGIKAVYNNTNSTAAELDSVRATLAAAVRLVDYIYEELYFNYPDIDTDPAFALLEQSSFTTDEVNAMYDDLYDRARMQSVYEVLDGASADDPRDGTSLIINSDFSEGNINGWDNTFVSGTTGTDVGYQNNQSYSNGDVTISQFIQAWAAGGAIYNPNCSHRSIGDAQLSQTLKGLPAGKYVLGADVIATFQDNGAEEVHGVQLFATGGSVDLYTNIFTANERPEHIELTFISDGGDITLGLRTHDTNANWIAADNFTLMYYGPVDDDPYKVILDEVINQYNEEFPDYGEDEMAYVGAKEAYKAEVEKAESLTEGFQEEMDPLTAAYKAFKAAIAEYEEFAELIAENEEKQIAFQENYPDLSDLLEDLRMEWENAYADCTADSEYIAKAKADMAQTIIEYITNNITPGSDITPLISNPSFDKAFDSWEYTGSRPGWGGRKSDQAGTWYPEDFDADNSGCAEVYHATFDMFQWIYNLPKGSYTFTCQAFERNDDGYENYWAQGPTAGINAVLYAGNYETKVNNIAAFASEEEYFDAGGQWWGDVYSSYGYVPNGMTGANYRFNYAPANYIVKVNVTIPQDGDSIKIGIRNTSTTNSWVLFDNFRMIYNGAGVDAYAEAIEEEIAKLESVFDEAIAYGTDAQEKVNATIGVLTAAKNGTDPDACAAALEEATETLEYARQSINLYNQIVEALNDLAIALIDYEETATAEAMAKANEVFDAANEGYDNSSFTNEEAQAMYDQILYVIAAFKVPDYEGASSDNMIDMTQVIENPTFDVIGDFTGWQGTAFGAGGEQSTSAEHYEHNFNSYQDLSGLPAGYYLLKVQGFYRRGTTDNDMAIEELDPDSACYARLYATSSVEDVEAPITPRVKGGSAERLSTASCDLRNGLYYPGTMLASDDWFIQETEDGNKIYYVNYVIVKVGDDGKLRIGVKKETTIQADWAIFDNWQLFYTGDDLPNSIKDVFASENNNAVINGIYNLAGQKLAAPQKGLNIINGKKVYIK